MKTIDQGLMISNGVRSNIVAVVTVNLYIKCMRVSFPPCFMYF